MSRQSTIIVITLLAIGVAAILIYTRILNPGRPGLSEVVVCEQCQHVFEAEAGRKEAPYECPECGAVKAYLAYQCKNPDCATIFPVTPEMLERDTIICPVCGDQARRLYTIPPNADALAKQIKEAEEP